MRRYTVLVLTTSGIFLMFVGVLTNSQALFYMSTVMLLMLVMMRVQAALATRGLRFERIAPGTVVAGELILMRIRVWSSTKLRRPLLFITDDLPTALLHDADIRPLPVAPSYTQAVETRYELRPLRRGVYRWSRIRVRSTDSLGIISIERNYETTPFEIVIHPASIPFGLDLVALSGWGANQADQGRNRGQGLEPRGVREFLPGDSLRQVHWRSTARTGTIQVKEFETGFNTNLVLLLQQSLGSEAGDGAATTLEAMCGHAVFLADTMLNRGSPVDLPNVEAHSVSHASSSSERLRQICDALAGARADRAQSFASEIEGAAAKCQDQSTLVLFVSSAEPGLSDSIRRAAQHAPVVLLVYDAAHFPGAALAKGMLPATDADFLAAVSVPRVAIRLMTNPFVTHEKAT
jgi:uncharacterized protein (DUF58 family)